MWKIFSFCKKYLIKYAWGLIAYIVISLSLSMSSLVTPYLMGSFIDHLMVAREISFIYRYFLIFITINLLTLLLGYLSGVLYVKLQTRIGYTINRDFVQTLQKSPMSFTQKQDSVYLNQRINSDSNSLVIFCIGIIQNVLINLLMIVIPITLMFTFNKALAAVLIIITVIYYVSYMLYKKLLYKTSLIYKESQSRFFGKLNEQMFNIKFIKLHGLFKSFINRLDESFNVLISCALRFQRVNYVFSGLDRIVLMAAQMILLFMGGIAIINGQMTIGKFTIVSSYFNLMLGAIRYFFGLGQTVQDNIVSYNRLQELALIKQEPNGNLIVDSVNKIELHKVSFAYDTRYIIKDMSVTFEKGKIYILSGENGTGKSTLIDILLGLQAGNFTGQILYNDISINSIDMYSLRNKCIGVSEQEPALLADTLAYNLCLDNEKTTTLHNDCIDKLAKMLNLESYICSLPNKFDTVINESSSNLSGGEKQKLSILRALIKNPDVLILDEPTSALDCISRMNLKKYLAEIKNDKIIIVITHDNDFVDDKEDVLFSASSVGV